MVFQIVKCHDFGGVFLVRQIAYGRILRKSSGGIKEAYRQDRENTENGKTGNGKTGGRAGSDRHFQSGKGQTESFTIRIQKQNSRRSQNQKKEKEKTETEKGFPYPAFTDTDRAAGSVSFSFVTEYYRKKRDREHMEAAGDHKWEQTREAGDHRRISDTEPLFKTTDKAEKG